MFIFVDRDDRKDGARLHGPQEAVADPERTGADGRGLQLRRRRRSLREGDGHRSWVVDGFDLRDAMANGRIEHLDLHDDAIGRLAQTLERVDAGGGGR